MNKEEANKKTKYNEVEAKDNMKLKKDKEDDIPLKDEEPKKLTKVVKGEAKVAKKGLAKRFVQGVTGPDGFSGIGEYVRDEVVVPAIKNIILDTISSSVGMVQDSIMSSINYKLFGEKGPGIRGSSYGRRNVGPAVGRSTQRPRVDYSTRATSYGRVERPSEPRRVAVDKPLGLEDYILADRDDAAHVLSMLFEHADVYNSVSVADYYDLIGVTAEYTDNNYGWTLDEIHKAVTRPESGGYVILFPPALPL